jgi:excisionase family DNA binding protein
MDRLLTSSEVCEILGISEPTLRRWTSNKSIPVVRLGKKGGRVRFKQKDIQAYIDANYIPEDPIHRRGN